MTFFGFFTSKREDKEAVSRRLSLLAALREVDSSQLDFTAAPVLREALVSSVDITASPRRLMSLIRDVERSDFTDYASRMSLIKAKHLLLQEDQSLFLL